MNTTRLMGIILLVVGLLIGVIAAAWLFTNEDLTGPARILGLGLALLVLVAPMVGSGIYLLAFGGQQARQEAEASKQRRLLNIVQSRGEVPISDVALEMQLPPTRSRRWCTRWWGWASSAGILTGTRACSIRATPATCAK